MPDDVGVAKAYEDAERGLVAAMNEIETMGMGFQDYPWWPEFVALRRALTAAEAVRKTKTDKAELIREAISDYYRSLIADDDPHNNALAEALDSVEVHDDGTWHG